MSPIFLWFDESFGCCRSKCRKRIHKKKSQESSGKPSLQSTLRGSINRIPNKWRPWLSQKELSPIIDGFVTDLCSFWHQWTCFFYRSEDFFRLGSISIQVRSNPALTYPRVTDFHISSPSKLLSFLFSRRHAALLLALSVCWSIGWTVPLKQFWNTVFILCYVLCHFKECKCKYYCTVVLWYCGTAPAQPPQLLPSLGLVLSVLKR